MRVQIDPNVRGSPFPHFLPLELFDNTEYDCRVVDEWLKLGVVQGEKKRKPVPGMCPLASVCLAVCVCVCVCVCLSFYVCGCSCDSRTRYVCHYLGPDVIGFFHIFSSVVRLLLTAT